VEVSTLGNRGILEDNQKTCIVPPFDFETPVCILVFRKGRLDVFGLELLGEADQVENACD